MLSDIAALDGLTTDWPDEHRAASAARVRAVDALNAAAFRNLIRAISAHPGLAAALRDAVQDEVVYAVLRRHGILKPSLHERVDAALDGIRPMLAGHGGNVELVSVATPVAEVRFLGACDGCPASALTFYSGVRKAILDAAPEITEIRQVKGLGGGGGGDTVHFTTPFASVIDGGWLHAAALADLADGTTLTLTVAEHSVLLSRFDDQFTCFENSCAHMGMPMDGGEIAGGILTCPYHGFKYALASGECLTAPEVALQSHAVRVIGDRVEIRLSSP